MKSPLQKKAAMEKLGRMMAEAIEYGGKKLRALAGIISKPIAATVERKIVTPLILTRHVLPVGETPTYQKETEIEAYWIAKGGDPRKQDIDEDEVTATTNRIHTSPHLDQSILKHGNVGTIQTMQKSSARSISKEIDKRTFTVIEAAILAAMTVTITGGKLTQQALDDAFALMEDKDLRVGLIAMRGSRHGNIKGFTTIPEKSNQDLWDKGVIAKYSGADILVTSSIADAKDVYLFPADEEIGKYPIKDDLQTKATEDGFKVGFLSWTEVGHLITRPDLIAKIRVDD